jgi:hypothetical protein
MYEQTYVPLGEYEEKLGMQYIKVSVFNIGYPCPYAGVDIRSPGVCFKSIGLQTSFLIAYLHACVCSWGSEKKGSNC